MSIKVCAATATRAEYGLLKPIIKKLKDCPEFEVKVAVTGMHLSPEFGLTYRELEADQIEVDKKIEILLSADTPSAISKSMGMALIGFADYFAEQNFQAILLLGDRYETLAIACAAMNAQIPIIHLHGGETTEGAVDEAVRHAITKLSYLHMTSTREYRRRVIQMGENPERVFCVGAMGVENAGNTKFLEKQELAEQLGMDLNSPFALVTFHPVTLEDNSSEGQTLALLNVLDRYPDWSFIVTKANADKDGRIINRLFEDYAASHPNVKVFDSLGLVRYLSAMKYCKMVIGNSSSGLLEAPSFHIPTINIGDRQKGRIRAESVLDCLPEPESILAAMEASQERNFQERLGQVINPYGDGNTSDRIITVMKRFLINGNVELKKKFYNIDFRRIK